MNEAVRERVRVAIMDVAYKLAEGGDGEDGYTVDGIEVYHIVKELCREVLEILEEA